MARLLGPAYAYLVDRTLFQRRGVQRYGTLSHEIDGETVLAPLDGLAADADRVRLGLPSLEAIDARIQAGNRRRAEALWAARGLPPGAAVRRVAPPWPPDELLARWRAEGRPVWSDGDHITCTPGRVRRLERGPVRREDGPLPPGRVRGRTGLFPGRRAAASGSSCTGCGATGRPGNWSGR